MKVAIISSGTVSSCNHKFGIDMFGTQLPFKSSHFEKVITEKRLELDKEKNMEAAKIAYDTALKCILEKK